MSDTKFTPGPWTIRYWRAGERQEVRIFAPDPTDGNRMLQVLSDSDSHPVIEHHDRRLADFKLMSHAPEMYELLEVMVNHPTCNKELPLPKKIIELINKINTP